jgi:uncharacterized membrane protein YkvA (DUF1232 family)|tara:strand:- start:154 stop:495 length:342 start_codon:yes stop_codon:yes gene_type:complete
MTGIPRLVFRLMMDRRVPLWTKFIIPAGIVYLILPFDVLPDMVPALGRIDDLLAIVFSVGLFLALSPGKVVSEHIRGTPAGDGNDSNDEDSPKSSVVDGSFRYLDDDEREKRG